MHILYMNQCYAPEDVSGAVLATELASDLVKKGHQVTVLTCAPNYPYGRIYAGYRNRLYQVEWLDGVRVVRTWNYISPARSFYRRILNQSCYSATSLYGGILAGKPDIVVSYSPPLPLGLSAWLLSRAWRVPWVLSIQDLYPEAAVAAGVIRNQSAIAVFSTLERFFYHSATHILPISESFRRNLIGKGVPPEKMTLQPVWADPDFIKPLPKANKFRSQHGLTDKFILMYAGNIGLTSSLEDVLAAAEILREDPDIRFVFIGEGAKKSKLQRTAKRKMLGNVIFLPYQPRELFPEMLAAADMGFVTLNSESSTTSLPHKIFNIMASARPIIAVTPPGSEIAQIIEEAKCGVNIPTQRPELIAKAIMKLKSQDDLLLEMGKRGRYQLENKFTRVRCVELHENILLSLCNGNRK